MSRLTQLTVVPTDTVSAWGLNLYSQMTTWGAVGAGVTPVLAAWTPEQRVNATSTAAAKSASRRPLQACRRRVHQGCQRGHGAAHEARLLLRLGPAPLLDPLAH